MATIPLPALDVKPPQSNPFEDYGRILQMKNFIQQQQTGQLAQQRMGLENQQLSEEVQDDAKWRSVLQDPSFDGTPEMLLQKGLKAGVGRKSYLTMQQAVTAHQQQLATLQKDQLDNLTKTQDVWRGQLQSIIDAPAEEKQNLWLQEKQKVPQLASQLPDVYPGDDQAQAIANHLALGSTLAKEASEQKTAAARQQEAQTNATRLAQQQNPSSPLYAPTPAYVSLQAQQGNQTAQQIQTGEVQQAGRVAGAQEQAKFPYQLQIERVRQQVAQTFQNNKDAQDKIEQSVLKPYEDKQSSVQELQTAIQQAQQGNVTSARAVLLKLIGVANPDGTKRYNSAEADRLLSQGSIGQRFAGTVKNLLTGDNWTDKMAQDMQNFAEGQGEVAKANLNRGIANVNKLYGTNVGTGLVQSGGSGGAASGTSIPANVAKALSTVGAGRHTLSDGSVWDKRADGTITPAGAGH